MYKVVLLAMATSACATSRIGEAEVQQQNGVPCFAVSSEEVRRAGAPALSALFVSDLSVKPVAEVWSFSLTPSGRTQPIRPEQCIRYAQTPANSEVGQTTKLVAGRVYEVFLNAQSTSSTDPTRGYMAKFCLIDQRMALRRYYKYKEIRRADAKTSASHSQSLRLCYR